MSKTFKFAALALFIGAAPALASDGGGFCGEKISKAGWLSQESVRAKLVNTGFDVRHVRPKHGCYLVKAYDKLGVLTLFYADPATAEVVAPGNPGDS